MLSFKPLHASFGAEVVTDVALRSVTDPAIFDELHAAMNEYAVLVFHQQAFSDVEQMSFARAFDGELHTKTGISVLQKSRLGTEALADIANVDAEGKILPADDRRRAYGLANRLWHTDASFEDPPGRYSMLSARVVPSVAAGTDFADTRAAYDALPAEMRTRLADLRAHHSIAYSRRTLGFEFSPQELNALRGAVQPLIRTQKKTGRKSLYVASHASHIIDWPLAEGRLLLRELIDHATCSEFVFTHQWQQDDFVIWDNRTTMHRAGAFDDLHHRRELRRVTTLDL